MRQKIRVWFNHWFSTAYHIINLLKNDDKFDFFIIGSNEQNDSVVKLACDSWFIEPRFENNTQYVNYCLQFCVDNNVDVFVPRRGMSTICKNIERFDSVGVKVLVERDYSILSMLNDKSLSYYYLTEKKFPNLPDTFIVNSIDEFEFAYKKLKTDENRVCIKLAKDEGGTSFKVIDDNNEGGHKISYTNTIKLLHTQCKNLLVMPYLNGKEVSIDCLKTSSENIFIPRYKTNQRAEEIYYDDKILDISAKFADEFKLITPFNIQFKYHDEIPYLLEVNTRMSGGIQLSCLATGVNIPNIAVNQLMGIDKTWHLTKKNCKVSYIETPVILSS